MPSPSLLLWRCFDFASRVLAGCFPAVPRVLSISGSFRSENPRIFQAIPGYACLVFVAAVPLLKDFILDNAHQHRLEVFGE